MTNMGNTNQHCRYCRYNAYKTKGGKGKICNGETMRLKSRCPEWAINEYLQVKQPRTLKMSEVVNFNQI